MERGFQGGMRGEPDESLLYYMSCRETADRAISDAAFVEFHRRHAADLYARCKRICRHLSATEEFAQDLVSLTLVKAAQRAHTFREVGRTQGWLVRIARNLLVDSLRNPRRSGPVAGEHEEIAFEDYSGEDFAALYCDGKAQPRTQQIIRLVQQAFALMDERTQAVLVHTVLQRQRSPKGSYMFRGSAEALAARLGTTTVNIRRIRMNGVRALAVYVQRHQGKTA